jgi:hypothetical protein
MYYPLNVKTPALQFMFDLDTQNGKGSDLIALITEGLAEKIKMDDTYSCEYPP